MIHARRGDEEGVEEDNRPIPATVSNPKAQDSH